MVREELIPGRWYSNSKWGKDEYYRYNGPHADNKNKISLDGLLKIPSLSISIQIDKDKMWNSECVDGFKEAPEEVLIKAGISIPNKIYSIWN